MVLRIRKPLRSRTDAKHVVEQNPRLDLGLLDYGAVFRLAGESQSLVLGIAHGWWGVGVVRGSCESIEVDRLSLVRLKGEVDVDREEDGPVGRAGISVDIESADKEARLSGWDLN